MPVRFLASIDIEASGLVTRQPMTPSDPPIDDILEIGLAVIDAMTLDVVYRDEWLVPPASMYSPGERAEDCFARWCANLREKNAFVYNMHEKNELLTALDNLISSTHPFHLPMLRDVEREIILALNTIDGAFAFDAQGVQGPIHPGNSTVMFTGNSIANFDIPMVQSWMPSLHKRLSYRIMDVSVLRTFFVELARVPLPDGLDMAIKSGGGGHRALSDALYCAESLKKLVAFTRAMSESHTHMTVKA